MKKTISQIKETISNVVKQKKLDAGFSGSWDDHGASVLEDKLEMFMCGVKSICDLFNIVPGVDDEIEIPKEFEEYFITEDPEYDEYKRLKEKFEK